MKYLAGFMLLLGMVVFPGCSEDEKAEAKELWLGIPNHKVPDSILKPPHLMPKETDSVAVEKFKQTALDIRRDLLSKAKREGISRSAMEQTANGFTQIEMENLLALMAAENRAAWLAAN